MFSILGWIIFGLIVGALAKLVMPGRDPGGIFVSIVLGIVGALLGGWLGRAIGLYGPDDAAGFVMALIGHSSCSGFTGSSSPGARSFTPIQHGHDLLALRQFW